MKQEILLIRGEKADQPGFSPSQLAPAIYTGDKKELPISPFPKLLINAPHFFQKFTQ